MRCGRWLAAARMRLCLSARARREAGARAALEISGSSLASSVVLAGRGGVGRQGGVSVARAE